MPRHDFSVSMAGGALAMTRGFLLRCTAFTVLAYAVAPSTRILAVHDALCPC